MRVACYRNFAACFQRVLVDGGKHRIFSAEDKQIFDDDFCAIKAEVHRLEDLMDVDAMERTCTSGPPLFLGHFSPIFPRFFPILSPFSPSCRQDSGNRHQDPEKRSETVEKRRVKNPKLT